MAGYQYETLAFKHFEGRFLFKTCRIKAAKTTGIISILEESRSKQTNKPGNLETNKEANKQRNKQTRKPWNKQGSKQTKKQANQETLKQTRKQTNKKTNKPGNLETNKEANKQKNKQTRKPWNKQGSKQTKKQTNQETLKQTRKQTNKKTNKHASQRLLLSPWYSLGFAVERCCPSQLFAPFGAVVFSRCFDKQNISVVSSSSGFLKKWGLFRITRNDKSNVQNQHLKVFVLICFNYWFLTFLNPPVNLCSLCFLKVQKRFRPGLHRWKRINSAWMQPCESVKNMFFCALRASHWEARARPYPTYNTLVVHGAGTLSRLLPEALEQVRSQDVHLRTNLVEMFKRREIPEASWNF